MAGERLLQEDMAVLAPADEPAPPASAAVRGEAIARAQPGSPAAEPDWQLALRIGRAGARSYIASQRVGYPFHLGRSLHMPGDPPDMPTYYVQSCSGGIFEHDRLGWWVALEAGSRLHLSTAASTVVHSMTVGEAVQSIELEVDAGGMLEYLPDPLILFPGARLHNTLSLRVAEDARVIAWDTAIAHDPQQAGGAFARLESQLRILDLDGTLCALDRYRICGVQQLGGLPGVTGGYPCHGSFLALAPRADLAALCEGLRTALAGCDDVYAGVSTLPRQRGAWVRVLAHDAAALKTVLQRAWRSARAAFGLDPGARRK